MKRIIAGNWKLHKNPEETRGFFTELLKKTEFRSDRELVFFPPATNLESTAQSLKAGSILWGSQNCCHEVKGAFTGEISAQTISYLGGRVVLIGHSERRTLFHETDELIAKKVRLAQSLDLTPYLCIGETLEERESGKTLDILKKQIIEGLKESDSSKSLVLAYEPVWAIGTGRVASLEQIQEVHLFIRDFLIQRGFSKETPLLYGGSVKPENASEIGLIPNVNGFLIGGASLEVESILKIYQA